MINFPIPKFVHLASPPTLRSVVAAILAMTTGLAAEEVRYEVTFTATWSAESHPTDFPPNPHFSGLIGGVHNASVQFWQPGGLASDGIKNVAELGAKSPLDVEVQAAVAAGTALAQISGGGIARSPGSVSAQFDVSDQFPLVSLVSMIAPSPDWFVGVHDYSLSSDGGWIGTSVVDLWPYDAGTDSGISFASFDIATSPREPISQLTGFPFEGTSPLGTFTFLRILAGDYNRSGTWDVADIDALTVAILDGVDSSQFDLDENGVVNVEDRVYWVNSLRRTYFGDADLDGAFDSGDLIHVLSAGQYEDAIVENSTWSTGDWDGDREFGSSDLIIALAAGGYAQGPRAALSVVPEPTTTILLLLGLIGVCHGTNARRRTSRRVA